MSGALCLLAANRVDEELVEFLRIAVALLAAGKEVTLVEVGSGRGVLADGSRLPEEAARYMEALAEDGVAAEPAALRGVLDALRSNDTLVRLAASNRRGEPELLRIDSRWLDRADGREDAAIQEMLDAGQIVREVGSGL